MTKDNTPDFMPTPEQIEWAKQRIRHVMRGKIRGHGSCITITREEVWGGYQEGDEAGIRVPAAD